MPQKPTNFGSGEIHADKANIRTRCTGIARCTRKGRLRQDGVRVARRRGMALPAAG
jgi:hypothetical protein